MRDQGQVAHRLPPPSCSVHLTSILRTCRLRLLLCYQLEYSALSWLCFFDHTSQSGGGGREEVSISPAHTGGHLPKRRLLKSLCCGQARRPLPPAGKNDSFFWGQEGKGAVLEALSPSTWVPSRIHVQTNQLLPDFSVSPKKESA